MRAVLAAALLCAAGCKNDQGFVELRLENIAVSMGDFDATEDVLTRLDVAHTPYEGFISQAVYDPEIDPDLVSLKVEDLLSRVTDNTPELELYDALFVNSGTRGLGEYVYNGVDPDDGIVSDADMLARVQTFVEDGGALIVSDWGYDLVEALWPDAIDFAHEDTELDAAQTGTSRTGVAAITDETLALELADATAVELQFDYSYWAVVEDVGPDTKVWMTGDVEYRVSDAEGYGTLEGVPLLVSFEAGRGEVVFSSFHWRAQRDEVADTMLQTLLPGMRLGTGSDGPPELGDLEGASR